MKSTYDTLSAKICKTITRKYSTSFSLGIYLLHRTLHKPIYAIYGFVRLADEIVDSFHGFDKQHLLDKFEQDTYAAIDSGISLNPVLNSFQETVHRFHIETWLIDTFLQSMRMDLNKQQYDQNAFKKYILGSAEVVGLMCLKVFVHAEPSTYDQLKDAAQALGSAFQKVNFLRDMQADYHQLGRSYFPDLDVQQIGILDKRIIEQSIERDFQKAEAGIRKLPRKARLGVFTAYIYYLKLFRKIKSTPVEKMLEKRIRIPNYKKLLLLPGAYVRSFIF
jgi:phytoene/squalene synthetase